MDYSNLLQLINTTIKANGQKAITGTTLNTVLVSMVEKLGKAGMLCAGVATVDTVPVVSTDSNIYYYATHSGTYTHFGNLVVQPGELALFVYVVDTWVKQTITIVETISAGELADIIAALN